MNLRRVTRAIEEKWANLGFETEINGDKADMHARINHPVYEGLTLEIHIRMFDNAARHFTMFIGNVPPRYADRAIESVNTFNLKHAWLKAYVEEQNGNYALYLKYSGVGYNSLPDDEVVTSILVAGDLMFNQDTANKMVAILDGEYL